MLTLEYFSLLYLQGYLEELALSLSLFFYIDKTTQYSKFCVQFPVFIRIWYANICPVL